ncbi:hypothetical protein WN982_03295 [Paraburkholderia sp. IMGN_8]|uniref:hypothetical protein n=1 Tax=Paraburkholderia sp. IMGN_8 TaxID=3136564 RepID=UPI003100EA50
MDDELAKLPYVIHPTGTSVPHFRAIIPVNLRIYADGQKVFKRTLGKDPSRQREQYAKLLSEYETLLANARAAAAQDSLDLRLTAGPVRLLKTLTDEDRERLNEFAESWQARTLAWHDEQVPTLTAQELDEYEQELNRRLTELKRGVRRMAPPTEWEAEVAELLEEEHRMRLDDECPDRRPFLMRVLAEELNAIKASLARFGGELVPTPPLPTASRQPAPEHASPTRASTPRPSNGYLLRQCLDDWLSTGAKKGKSRKEFANIFTQFVAFIAANNVPVDAAGVDDIKGRPHVIAWLESVARDRGVQRKTLSKYLAAVRAVLEIATSRGNIDVNAAMGIKLDTLALRGLPAGRVTVAKAKRHPLDADEITRFFGQMNYWLSDHRVERAVSYWLPLLLFAFGARPEEMATLVRDDIRIDDSGQHWIHIFSPTTSPDGLARIPKRNASVRHLPVPPWLMQLGFGEYIATIPHGQWLLPCKAAAQDADADSAEGRVRQTLNYLNPFLRQVVGITDAKKTIYSLRHTFRDELRRAKVPREVQDALTGHAGADTNAGVEYYGSTWYPEEPLLEAMCSLRHLELLPVGYPTWPTFRDSPRTGDERQLVKK